jgi:hypothetical protein
MVERDGVVLCNRLRDMLRSGLQLPGSIREQTERMPSRMLYRRLRDDISVQHFGRSELARAFEPRRLIHCGGNFSLLRHGAPPRSDRRLD